MDFRSISPTKADFDGCAWQEVIESAETRECSAYWESFGTKAKEAQEAGNEQAQEVFTLLNAATSLFLKEPNNAMSPFCPMFTSPRGRTADVDDFSDEHVAVFSQLIPKIEDPELRARIADIVWVRKRGHQVAAQAVSAYLESARQLEATEMPWPPCIDRTKRAVTLAVLHGRNSPTFKQVIAHIEDTLDRHKYNDLSYLSAELMEIMLEKKEGDSSKFAQLSQMHALAVVDDEDWARPKRYLELQARWLERANDKSGSRAARIRAAETYVHAAKERSEQAQPDNLGAAMLLQSAIEAYRRIGGEKERIEKLHHVLLEYKRRGTDQMGSVSAETSITEPYIDAINSVKGKELSEAIRALATIEMPPNLNYLRQLVEELKRDSPLIYLIPWFKEDESGRTTGFAPSSLSEDANGRDDSTRSHLLRHASQMRSLTVVARFEPARRQILEEHYVRVQDFLPLVTDHPFVPMGREVLYARGLHAGLEGDFVVAAHLLIPQMENSIRHVLTQHGVITSGLEPKGIQDVHLLKSLLDCPEVEKILGEDLTFDLQGLLLERLGDNLRNRVAHGLMEVKDFFRTDAIYLWWLTLHMLVCFQIARASQTE